MKGVKKMSENIKTITIYNSENKLVEERNIGVDAERVDCGESTLDTKLQNIDNNIETINNKVNQVPKIGLHISNFGTGIIDEDSSTVIFPDSSSVKYIPTWEDVQKGFYKTVGKNNILTENKQMPSDVELNSPPITGGPGTLVNYDKDYDVISMKFLRKNFYYTDGEEPSLSKYKKQITLIPADSNEEIPIVPGETILNKTYTIVENNKIYQLDPETEMILIEAKTLNNSAKIGDSINIIIYSENVFIPPEPSGKTPVFKFIEKSNMTEFDLRQMPDNKTVYDARSLWKQNQLLMKYIEDLYKQIDELKSNGGE